MAERDNITLRRLRYFWEKVKLYINEAVHNTQPAVEEEKEIVWVLTADSTAPEEASEGALYINTSSNILYVYEDGDWEVDEASSDVFYVAEDNGHIYVYIDGEFVDSTGVQTNGIIPVSNLTTDLEGYTEDGVYTVCYTPRGRTRVSHYYTFVVNHSSKMQKPRGRVTVYSQMLSDNEGYMVRTHENTDPWSEWKTKTYAYQEDVEEMISGMSVKGEKEVINVLTYGNEAPSGAEADDIYINVNGSMYIYDGEQWNSETPDKDVVYITNDTRHIYMWDDVSGLFVDITGTMVDKTLYVSSLTDSIMNSCQEAGLYTVCVGAEGTAEWYTMSVSIGSVPVKPSRPGMHPGRATVWYQNVRDERKYMFRDKTASADWTAWVTRTYAFEENVATLIAQAAAGLIKMEAVNQLPSVADAETNTIYLVPNGKTGNNVKDEYILVNGAFELIGTTKVEVDSKADKVSGATAGHLAGLDANGNLTDSGKSASDFATAAQGAKADTALQPADIVAITTSEIDALFPSGNAQS